MATNKLLSFMKLIGMIFIMTIITLPANAQFLRTSYFMEGTHYRQQLNPALTPTKGFINLPVIGAVNATVGSTSLGYQDIIDIIDDGGDFYTKPDFMNRLKDNNTLNVNFSTEILSAGWYKGKNFWSFNIGLRTDIGANLTKSMFTFLNQMETIEDNWRNSNYDISGQQLNINAYTEIGLGLSRQINSRLTVGARVKALLGIGNMELKLNRIAMSANLPTDQQINEWSNDSYWSGSLGEIETKAKDLKAKFDNYHANLTVGAELKSSFKGLELKEEEGKDYVTDFDFDSGNLGIAGYGFGIDLGASYKILDNLTVYHIKVPSNLDASLITTVRTAFMMNRSHHHLTAESFHRLLNSFVISSHIRIIQNTGYLFIHTLYHCFSAQDSQRFRRETGRGITGRYNSQKFHLFNR